MSALNTSAGMLSGPAALLFFRDLTLSQKVKLKQDKQLTSSGVNREGILVGPFHLLHCPNIIKECGKTITTVKREGREGNETRFVQAHGRLCTAHDIKLAPDLLLELNINNAYYSKLNSISKGET